MMLQSLIKTKQLAQVISAVDYASQLEELWTLTPQL